LRGPLLLCTGTVIDNQERKGLEMVDKLIPAAGPVRHVRASTPADLAAVDALLAGSYPRLLKRDYPPSVLVTALPLISRAQPALLGSGTYYVAEDAQGEIIGAGGWSVDRQLRHRGHIRHVVADHRLQRRGIARRLVGHALRIASAAGLREMECWATLTAVRFYEAMGFAGEGPMEVPLAPGITFPCMRMRQRLEQP